MAVPIDSLTIKIGVLETLQHAANSVHSYKFDELNFYLQAVSSNYLQYFHKELLDLEMYSK